MKIKLLTLAVAVLASCFIWVGTASASGMRSGETVTVGKDETVDGTFYGAGTSVNVLGTVKGDVFCAGQQVEISGVVEGDVICAAQSLRVSGKVLGDVRLAGQTVTFTGDVAGSATIFGQSVGVENTAKIGRDLQVFGQATHVAGSVTRDVAGFAESLTVAGTVGRNVNAFTTLTTLNAAAKVGGDFTYTSENTLKAEQGSVVSGKTERKEPTYEQKAMHEESWSDRLWAAAYWFGAMLLIGWLGLWLAPWALNRASDAVLQHPLATLGTGLVALLLVPVVAVLLLITIIGIPLAIITLLAYVVALLVSTVFAGYTLGQFLIKNTKHQITAAWLPPATLAIGLAVLILAQQLPYIGGIVSMGALLWGLGAPLWFVLNRNAPKKKTA